MPTYGSDTVANTLMTSLLAGEDFNLPDVDLSGPDFAFPVETGELYADIDRVANEDLTSKAVGGSGTFDVVMAGIDAHLKREYENGRITGAEYSKVYVALTESALGNSVQFLLGKEQSYWQAMAAKYQAQAQRIGVITAKVQLETAKVQLQALGFEVLANGANYALTKAKIATEDAQYGAALYNLSNILPEQLKMVKEQAEAQRAQTLDVRFDGSAVSGSIGKQKELYTQQITSYRRDAEVKAAKIFSDAWIAQKSVDEGLLAPTNFQNATIDTVLSKIKTANELT
jgi:hypothetical protein